MSFKTLTKRVLVWQSFFVLASLSALFAGILKAFTLNRLSDLVIYLAVTLALLGLVAATLSAMRKPKEVSDVSA